MYVASCWLSLLYGFVAFYSSERVCSRVYSCMTQKHSPSAHKHFCQGEGECNDENVDMQMEFISHMRNMDLPAAPPVVVCIYCYQTASLRVDWVVGIRST